MFCTKCGTQVDQGDNFCRNCGVRIERRSAMGIGAAEAVIAAPSSETKLAAPAQASSGTDARVSAPDLKEGRSNKAVVGAIGVSVFLVAAGGIYFGSGSSRPVAEREPSSQAEEPLATKILHNDSLPSSEEAKVLPAPVETRLASVNQSEIVEAPHVAQSSKPANETSPPPSKSQGQRSAQDPARISRPVPQAVSRAGAQPGVYETVHNTTVYEDPSDSAKIVADIPAGMRVNVVSATGEWLEVHSRRGNPPGFIRRGDAVFVESLN